MPKSRRKKGAPRQAVAPRPPRRPKRSTRARAEKPPNVTIPQIARNGIATVREPVTTLTDAQALDLALRCRTAAVDKKAENVVMLDIRRRANFADYFVLATGRSVLQARAIADGIVEASEFKYGAPIRTEGYNEGGWILIDYGAVIVHVFTPQAREFYDLDRLWGKPERARKGPAGRAS